MCSIAKAVEGTYNVVRFEEERGISFVYLAIDPDDPYRSYKALPAVIEFRGRTLGKSCFDSDKNITIYRSDSPVATAVKRFDVKGLAEWIADDLSADTDIMNDGGITADADRLKAAIAKSLAHYERRRR
jgi:hypothetical protein